MPHALLRIYFSRLQQELSAGEVSEKHRQRRSDISRVFVRVTCNVMIDRKAEVRTSLEIIRQHLQNFLVYFPHTLVVGAERLRLALDQRFSDVLLRIRLPILRRDDVESSAHSRPLVLLENFENLLLLLGRHFFTMSTPFCSSADSQGELRT